MVKLRLRRMGANDQPFYRIVAMDSRKKRDGKYIECIGWYDPKPTPSTIKIETERALYWLGVGAQPSDTVRSLLRKAGILQIRHEKNIQGKAAADSSNEEVRNEGTD
jgi:small subunit ribosomal protein S16